MSKGKRYYVVGIILMDNMRNILHHEVRTKVFGITLYGRVYLASRHRSGKHCEEGSAEKIEHTKSQ